MKLFVALIPISLTIFASSAFAQAPSSGVQSELQILKAENAQVRELLLKMGEQQKALLEQVDRLQQRLDGLAPAPAAAAQPPAAQPEKEKDDHYQDGIVIWQNPETAKVPFLLKFNNNTQVRYLNTTNSN